MTSIPLVERFELNPKNCNYETYQIHFDFVIVHNFMCTTNEQIKRGSI